MEFARYSTKQECLFTFKDDTLLTVLPAILPFIFLLSMFLSGSFR